MVKWLSESAIAVSQGKAEAASGAAMFMSGENGL